MVPGGLTRVALPGGQPGRELEPGRRLEGHLGARGRRSDGREASPAAPRRRRAAGRCPSAAPDARPAARAGRSSSNSSNDAAAIAERRRAEPHRRVAVLDRPLRRAGRGHRAPPRRALPPPARGPPRRRGGGVPGAARRDGRRRPRRIGEEPDAAAVTALLAQDLDVLGLDRVLDRVRRGRTHAARARRSRRRCGRRSTPRYRELGRAGPALAPGPPATTSSAGCATGPPRATASSTRP